MVSEQSPFKNWINAEVVNKYARGLEAPSQKEFQKISQQLSPLELRARVQLIANTLKLHLHQDFSKALQQLLQITREQQINAFELWPATEFIQIYGLQHIDESLDAMYELTQKFTAEFCVRPFINTHGEIIFKKLKKWQNDHSEHIRRWLSEGTRPRLPWGERLPASIKNPKLNLEVLESLKFDPSLYVRKSVANHLNDIAKDHPQIVIKTLTKWSQIVPKGFEREFEFIRHRALRTLIKGGNTQALKLIGVKASKDKLKVEKFQVTSKHVKMNSNLEFSAILKNNGSKKEKYVLDFVIYFQKANGKLSPKTFKLKSGLIAGKTQLSIKKKYSFKPITTRKYYPGPHKIALKLNGLEGNAQSFTLRAK